MKLILASNSPRRKEILERLGLDFETMPAAHAIEPEVHSFSDAIVAARVKAHDVAMRLNPETKKAGAIVIGADTVVVLQGEVLGKPKDKKDAKRMLKMLSGKQHTVATGLSLVYVHGVGTEDFEAFSTIGKTEVVFRALNDEEINRYVETGEPMDKAGSYAIQGIGSILVESVHGCFNNVVGLPTTLLLDQLAQLNYESAIL